MSSSLLLLWAWNRTDQDSWCGRRSAAGDGGHKASSSWQQMRTDSSPHWHRSAGGGAGLLSTRSPGPAGHPEPGQVRLKQVRYEILCEDSDRFRRREEDGLQEDGSTYLLSRWPQLPYFHLLEDNGYGCCDDTVELKALCPHSEFHWESHQLHLDHRTSTRSPVKEEIRFSMNEQHHSSLLSTVNGQRVWSWIGLHVFICCNISLFVLSSIIQHHWRVFDKFWGMKPLTILIWHFQNYINWFRSGGAMLSFSPGHDAHNFTHWWPEKLEGACGIIVITQAKGGTTIGDQNDMLTAYCQLWMLCWSWVLLPDEHWQQSPGRAVCTPPWLRWCPSSHYRQHPIAYDPQPPSKPPHGLLMWLYHQQAVPGRPLD